MSMLHTCIIDDEPLAASLIEEYVRRTPFLELVGIYNSAQEAAKQLFSNEVDLVFLDINLPQLSGVELARILPPGCKVVFITAHENYAVDGFKVGAVDYLLKPVDYEEFLGAARKALASGSARAESVSTPKTPRSHIIVKSEYRLVQIATSDIVYIEGLKDYIKIFVEGEPKPVLTLMNMRTLEAELPSGRFMRVHRSFIVNTDKIKVIERNRIVFDAVQIPISESYKQDFSEFVKSRLIGSGRVSGIDA